MPKMGISVSEGTILEWRKQPGDWIEADETIADVTTDKVDVEIPSPASGRLARLIAEPGETRAGRRADRRDRRRREAGRGASRRGAKPAAGSSAEPRPEAGGGRSIRRSPTGRGSSRRWCGGSPTSTASTSSRSRAPGSAGGCARRTCSRTSSRRRQRPGEAGAGAAHRVAVPARRAGAGRSRAAGGDRRAARAASGASRCRRCARRSPSTWSRAGGPSAHCTTIVEVDMSRVAARRARAQGADEAARRAAHLPRLRRPGDGRGAAGVPGPERVGRRRRDRLPRRRQPRDRGRARRRADRAGDPAGAAAQRSRGWRRRSPTSPSGRARSASSPTRSTAARSRSPTRASSARCSRRRSSTSRRWRSSTSRRSSSGRWWSRGRTGDSIAIRPMTYLPMSWDHRALDGAEAAQFLSRVKRRLEGWEVELMAIAIETPGNGRAGRRAGLDRRTPRSRRSPSTTSSSPCAAASAAARTAIVAIHSTALGPALGGLRIWHYPATIDARARRAAAGGRDDLQGGRRRARPRRRQGRDLRARRRPRRASGAGRRCSTSATWSSRSTAATSPPRTSASAPADLVAIGERTGHLTGLPPERGGSGDPSPFTAIGRRGRDPRLRRATRFGDSRSARPSASCVVGLGHVGAALARRLAAAGCELIVSDIDPRKRALAERARRRLGRARRRRCWPSATCSRPARSAARSRPTTSARLRCEIVCGSANNQLADEALADVLAERGDPLRARLHRQRGRPDPRLHARSRATRRGARSRSPRGSRRPSAGVLELAARARDHAARRGARARRASGSTRLCETELRWTSCSVVRAGLVPYDEARRVQKALEAARQRGRGRRRC